MKTKNLSIFSPVPAALALALAIALLATGASADEAPVDGAPPASAAASTETAPEAMISIRPEELERLLTGPFSEDPLSLRDAVARAFERNPSAIYARIDVMRAEETLKGEKGSLYLPSLSADASRGVSSTLTTDLLAVDNPPMEGLVPLSTGSWVIGLAVTEPLPTGGAVTLRFGDVTSTTSHANSVPSSFSSSLRVTVDQPLLRSCCWFTPMGGVKRAKSDLEDARLRLQRALNDVAANVMHAYWDLVFARTELELKKAAIANLDRRSAWTEAGIAEGRIARTDIIQVRASRAAALDTYIGALNRVLNAEEYLKTLLGAPSIPAPTRARPLPLEAVPIEVAPTPPLEEAFSLALARSPAIALVDKSLERAELDRRLARDALWPRLDFTASFAARGSGDTRSEEFTDLADLATRDWSVGLRFSMPLFYNADKATAKKAAYTLDTRTTEAEAARRALHEELDALVRALAAARIASDLASARVALSSASLAAEEEKFADGRTTLKDLLDFQEALEQARVNEARARVEQVKARIRLERVTGTLIEVMEATR